MIKAKEVANLFLSWATENGDLVTNLKMQKLLYYAQAWYLVNFGKPLFEDKILAWDLGPVIEKLYHEWKKYSNTPIPYRKTGKEKTPFNKAQLKFLEEFFRIYSNFSATTLVSMTHNEDPWRSAKGKGVNAEISLEAMKRFYKKQYRQLSEQKK